MRKLDESGQTQILAASIIGIVILGTALFGLQYALQNRVASVKTGRRSEVRAALDQMAKQVAFFYHSESSCVPATLDSKLHRLELNGTVRATGSAPTRRQMDLLVNGKTVRVGFGAVRVGGGDPGTGPASELPATPQDASVEIWASLGRVRVSQKIGLINNCAMTCATQTRTVNSNPRLNVYPSAVWGIAINTPPTDSPSDPCTTAAAVDPGGLAYHYIHNATNYPVASRYPSTTPPFAAGSGWSTTCFTGRKIGELDYYPPAAPLANDLVVCTAGDRQPLIDISQGIVGPDDLSAMRNYVRSGDARGTCQAVVTGSTSGSGTAENRGCGDINGDGVVDPRDVGLLEKALRGYLYWIPTHY